MIQNQIIIADFSIAIVRNLCNNHPKSDVSCLPKVDDIVNIQNRMFLVLQKWMIFCTLGTGDQ